MARKRILSFDEEEKLSQYEVALGVFYKIGEINEKEFDRLCVLIMERIVKIQIKK